MRNEMKNAMEEKGEMD
uniref:Uncharacterized protein n=1 Tax=Rhizophora mucronata TaxID=61149 RepID=A0A2P2LIC8_RHIMU